MRRAAAVAPLAVALSALAGCGFTPLYAELPATGLSQGRQGQVARNFGSTRK